MKPIQSLFGVGFAFVAINACATVAVKPTIAKTQVVLDVTRTSADAAKILGVHYDKAVVECTAPNTDSSPTSTVADGTTVKTLDGGHWTITCMRKSQTIGADVVYPAADITLTSTDGPFSFSIPADARVSYQFASDLQRRMDAINTRFGKIAITGSQSKYPAAPPGCPAGTYFSGYIDYNTYPGGRSGQGTATRVCFSVAD